MYDVLRFVTDIYTPGEKVAVLVVVADRAHDLLNVPDLVLGIERGLDHLQIGQEEVDVIN